MRVFVAAIFLAVLLVAAGVRPPAPLAETEVGHDFVSTAELIALQARPRPTDFAGGRFEFLFVPDRSSGEGGTRLLRDTVTDLTCVLPREAVERLGRLGDDFLVVRGRLGLVEPGRSTPIGDCRVIADDGLAWEEARSEQRRRARALYEAGQL